MTRTVLITGIGGQDGSYAAELCLARGDRVVGTGRDPAALVGQLPAGLAGHAALRRWDMNSLAETIALVEDVRPDEIYNFAAEASGAGMYDEPLRIAEINGLAVARLLEAVRQVSQASRLVQASSSELFGLAATSPQSETTPLRPRSPYGAAKLYAHNMVEIYRRHHGLFACSAILFNHESPRRGEGFVTRRVTRAAAAISLGLEAELTLGNLDATRDWGFAGDTVAAMALMLAAPAADDYVVATGVSHSVRDLCRIAFAHVGLDYRDHVRTGEAAFRAAEPVPLVGNAAHARDALGWRPRIDFAHLVAMMVDADLDRARARACATAPASANCP